MDGELTESVALVVHELRRPLGYLATAAQLMGEEAAEDDIRSRCERMERTARRMLRMTETVLDATAVIASQETARGYSPGEVAAQLADDARGLGLPLRLEIEPGAGGAVAFGRRGQFETLLQSLLNNAVDHGSAGSDVVLRVSAGSQEVCIDIENEVGAPNGHRGLGLGLLLCRRLADLCGAQLEAATGAGWYRATIRLALSDPDPATRSQHRAPLPAHLHLRPIFAASV